MPKMCRLYRRHSKAQGYIIGFIYNEQLYIYNATTLKNKWLKIAYASGSHKPKIQMQLNNTHKIEMINQGATAIMQVNDFLNINALNNGWRLEQVIYQLNGIAYKGQDKIPFYQGGDITLNGIEIQIKFENAQIATYATLNKLAKAQ